jgi:hypothetical protein
VHVQSTHQGEKSNKHLKEADKKQTVQPEEELPLVSAPSTKESKEK